MSTWLPMSLRLRLNLLLTMIFLLVVAIGAVHVLTNVREAVAEELRSSVELSSGLLALLVGRVGMGDNTSEVGQLLDELRRAGKTRHLHIAIVNDSSTAVFPPQDPSGLRADAPRWFVRLVHPELIELQQTVLLPGGQQRVLVRADPTDEISEAWRETRVMFGALLVFCLIANGLIYIIIGRSLRPLGTVSEGLEGIERGDFSYRLPRIKLPEMDVIVKRFNHMASVLERSRRDTGTFARRSLAIQEDERRRLARELHDEMGQSISAIKALAVSIVERADTVDEAVRASAATIAEISTDIYEHVRQMMTRLRPVALDELGFVSAVQNMVDDWNEHHEHIFCRFGVDGDIPALSNEISINMYRIAQEALTNIAKHADATEASVRISRRQELRGSSKTDLLVLEVSDNGIGFDPDETPRGLGLVGIRERSEAINGDVHFDCRPAGGVAISVRLPLHDVATT